jgi:CheY-like chemotaxis protein
MLRESLLIRTLVQLADNLVDDFDVIDVLGTLADRCVEALDVDAAGVMLAGPDGELQVVASSSEAMRILELFQLQASEGPCVDCYRTGEPIVNRQLSGGDGRWPSFTRRAVGAGFHSVHSLPMRLRGRTVGALNMFRTDSGDFSENDVIAAQALADVATIAIVQNHQAVDVLVLNAQLTKALNSRVVIEQAKGMVSEATGLEMDEAFTHLRDHVRAHGFGLASFSRLVADGTVNPGTFGPEMALPGTSAGDQVIGTAVVNRTATVTICVVEDNKSLRDQLVELLTDSDVQVLAAVGTVKDGEKVITAYRPDVAIIDYNLPDGTGVDLIRTLSETVPQVTLLLYSASVTEDDARLAVEAGATAVIAKSLHTEELLEAVMAARHIPKG